MGEGLGVWLGEEWTGVEEWTVGVALEGWSCWGCGLGFHIICIFIGGREQDDL